MNSLLTSILVLATLLADLAAADKIYAYQVAVVGNAAPGSACAELGAALGPQLLVALQDQAPWLAPYPDPVEDGSDRLRWKRRFLRAGARHLATNVCARDYCSRSRNWNWCYFNGCRCTCGNRRELAQSDTNGGDIQAARKEMQLMVADAAATIEDCELRMVMTRVLVDDS